MAKKDHSGFTIPERYVVFDTETTGFKNPKIVEIAALKYENGVIVDRKSVRAFGRTTSKCERRKCRREASIDNIKSRHTVVHRDCRNYVPVF